jgi:hypothetical protein
MLIVNLKQRPLFINHEHSSDYVIPYIPITSTTPLIKYLHLGYLKALIQVGRLCYITRKKSEQGEDWKGDAYNLLECTAPAFARRQ